MTEPPKSSSVELASLLANTQRRIDPEVWKKICPGLSIGETAKSRSEVTGEKEKELEKHNYRKEKLINNGYALVNDLFDVRLVRGGIEALHKKGLPATFILLFDEAWELACQSKTVLDEATHEKNVFNYDLLAWYIPPGSPGFSPHRDRQPDDAPSTFHSNDQQAKFVTNWIALSDATPENSCLYVIPKPFDPGYTVGDPDTVPDENDNTCGNGTADPLHRALSTKESFQHIRSLPRKAGQSILFTHRIIHWGSQADSIVDDNEEAVVAPRIAISFVCSDPEYEAPLLANHAEYFAPYTQFPPLHIRLLLVCAQLLIYYQRFDLNKSIIKACYDYCKQHEGELEETYRRKVYVEFVNAMKEQTGQSEQPAATLEKKNKEEIDETNASGDDGDEDEDAMLEEMLNAEAGGYGEFEDDYDDIEEADDEMGRNEEGEEEGEDEDEEFDLFGGKNKNGDEETSPAKKKVRML